MLQCLCVKSKQRSNNLRVLRALRGKLILAVTLLFYLSLTAAEPLNRHLRMGYTLRNTSNELIQQSDFYVRVPLAQTPWQSCSNITASVPFETVNEPDGGQIIHFCLTDLLPFASRVIWIDVDVEMQQRDFEKMNREQLLKCEGLFQADDIAFQKELRRLKHRVLNPAELPNSINSRVHQIVKMTAYSSKNRGAAFALKTGKGDCSEQMALATALCRLSAIPAIGVSGVRTFRNRVMHPSDYHDWSAVYANRKWSIADPLYNYYNSDGSNYIAFEWIYGTELPDSYLRRYKVSNSNIKVRME